MYFSEIPGHDLLKKRFIQIVKENRISHAWLFHGPEGAGALPLAIAFAGYILCINRNDTDACRTCSGCNKTGKHIHPDLHFVFPVNKTQAIDRDGVISDDFLPEWRNFLLQNPYGRLAQWYNAIELENKQGIISTEESKRLTAKLSFKAFESDHKIAILWQPEKMNDQASNKLLKLLEEPPPLTVLILVSENPDQLLPTVRSRCVPVNIPRISDRDLCDVLTGKHKLSIEAAELIVGAVAGNYQKALEMINVSEDDQNNFKHFRVLMRSCFKNSIPEMILLSEDIAMLTREKQKLFLEYGLKILRESLALHFSTTGLACLSPEEQEFTAKFAPYVKGNNIIYLTGEFTKAIQDIERNANSRIVFLDMALKLSALIKS